MQFLISNDTFKGPVSSLIKVFTMILGEFDFEDNFLHDKVAENNGSNWSVQILLIMLIVYGSIIIMNLITAWIFLSNESEVVVALRNIDEIKQAFGQLTNEEESVNKELDRILSQQVHFRSFMSLDW